MYRILDAALFESQPVGREFSVATEEGRITTVHTQMYWGPVNNRSFESTKSYFDPTRVETFIGHKLTARLFTTNETPPRIFEVVSEQNDHQYIDDIGEQHDTSTELLLNETTLPSDFEDMLNSQDKEKGLRGQELADYWDNIGKGSNGFYDNIRKNGCSYCGSGTPGCCDACA